MMSLQTLSSRPTPQAPQPSLWPHEGGSPIPLQPGEYELADGVILIVRAEGVLVQNDQGNLLVNDIPVEEMLLSEGDALRVGDQRWRFHTGSVPASMRQNTRRHPAFIALAVGLLLASAGLLAFDYYNSEEEVIPTMQEWTSNEGVDQQVDHDEQAKSIPLSSDQMDALVASGRSQLEAAQLLFEHRYDTASNLYDAMRIWRNIKDYPNDLSNSENISRQAEEMLKKGEEEHALWIGFLKNNAYIALRTKNNAELRRVLLAIQQVTPDTTHPDYLWAKRRLKENPPPKDSTR